MTSTPAPRELLLDLYNAAIGAVHPRNLVQDYLPPPPANGRTLVIGAGKASAEMARVVEQHWRGELSGLVVTRYGYSVPCRIL